MEEESIGSEIMERTDLGVNQHYDDADRRTLGMFLKPMKMTRIKDFILPQITKIESLRNDCISEAFLILFFMKQLDSIIKNLFTVLNSFFLPYCSVVIFTKYQINLTPRKNIAVEVLYFQ